MYARSPSHPIAGTILALLLVMATTQTRKDTSAVPEIEIGIDANARKSLADGLSHMLADTVPRCT